MFCNIAVEVFLAFLDRDAIGELGALGNRGDRGAVGSGGHGQVPFYSVPCTGSLCGGQAEFCKGSASGRTHALDVRR